MSITVTQLSKHYGAQKAVNNISFSIQKGEIVGFLGPNGAGKSTTMKMITGYLPADNGTIEVCGLLAGENAIAAKKKIGYLPEANPLYLDMYVKEYLHFIAGLHHIHQPAVRVKEVIDIVGLTPEAHKKIAQLSKGYKQRVGLAAALVHDPPVLILDEPTSGLDPNQIIEIRNVIKSLAIQKTILFSSHIMQEVEAICDRVIIIHKGNIVADDQLSQLQQSGNNGQLVRVVFKESVAMADLQQLSGVQSIQLLATGSFNIACEDAEAVKKQLLQLSIDQNLNIISLQSQTQNLESIFKSLTTSIPATS
ncbi:MAG: gliding motility-associated ABC transporter ATP-binding subunit GldA [Ferruginibacter sp.]